MQLQEKLKTAIVQFHTVVPFDKEKDRLLLFDLSENNKIITEEIFNDINKFSAYVDHALHASHSKYAIGGYNELRGLYARSELFETQDEPRRLHLGIDIWGKAGTSVSAPLGGMVHSFAMNDHYGDYGATIILQHQLDGFVFHTLYGHLSLRDLQEIKEGQFISQGQVFAHFGEPAENGQWPPHLHFQLVIDMRLYKGDYPGVCGVNEKEKYLANCPDPDLLLDMMQYARV